MGTYDVAEQIEKLQWRVDFAPDDEGDEVLDILESLEKDGWLSKEQIVKWAEAHSSLLIESFVSDKNFERWKRLGVEPEKFKKQWIEFMGEEVIWYDGWGDLPKLINPKDILDTLGMREVLRLSMPIGFDRVLTDYTSAGGDLEELKDRFLAEIGYSSEPVARDALIDLINAGAKVDLYLSVGVVELSSCTALDKECYAEIFRKAGAKEELVQEMLAY